jgi:hypothetical protein
LKRFDLVANIDIRHSYLQSSWLRNLIGIPLKFGNFAVLLLVILLFKVWFFTFCLKAWGLYLKRPFERALEFFGVHGVVISR